MRPLSLLAAALLAAAPALAQEAVPLTPGHEDLVIDALSYESVTFDVRTTEPDQSIGMVTQSVTTDGEYALIVTDTNVPQLGQVWNDSVRVLRSTLAPAYIVSTNRSGERATAEFANLRVTGLYGPSGRELPLDLELKEPAFPAGGTSFASGTPLVARSLPFREGYVGTFTTFSPRARLQDVTLTVAGREDTMRPDGSTVSAWKIEEREFPGGPVRRTYSVDPDTRDLIRVRSTQGGADIVIVPADPEAMAAEAAARDALPVIEPGSDDLMPEMVTPYEQSYTLQLIQPQEMEIGNATNRLTVDEAAGTVTLVTVLNITMQGATQSDSTVAAYPSLAPISETASGGGATVEVAFGGDAITGRIAPPGGEETAIDETLDEPVFAASMLGEVVRALPLAEGYKARLKAYAPGGGVRSYAVEVTGEDEESGAWTVSVTPDEAPPTIYTIDPDSREILKTRLQPQIGVVLDLVAQE